MKDRLRLVLSLCRISQAELARVSGVARNVLMRVLRGESRNVSLETALRFSDALGITLDWIAGRDVPGPKPVAVRHHFACKGGRVMGEVRAPSDPINVMNGAGNSRRGRVRVPVGPRSVPLGDDAPAAAEDAS